MPKNEQNKASSSSSSAVLPFLPLPLDVLAQALSFLSLRELSASAVRVDRDFHFATIKVWSKTEEIQIRVKDIKRGSSYE
jgi:hypothetical protein